MFGIFQSESGKLRETAKHWLYLGAKVYHFRKDELLDSDIEKLSRSMDAVRAGLKGISSDKQRLKNALAEMESLMKEIGGSFYPRSSIGENVEFFFVAMIIYIGITTFFVKPFKIPTNSMWPTYFGMTAEVWNESEAPGSVARMIRLLAYGASRYEIEAPVEGELMIPVVLGGSIGRSSIGLYKYPVSKRKYLVLPGEGVGYEFMVGNQQMKLKVPKDFSLEESVLRDAWFPDEERFDTAFTRLIRRGKLTGEQTVQMKDARGYSRDVRIALVKTGKFFKKGETVLSFDILTGDQLFVDRMSYHFAEPKVGDGFVFRTGKIKHLKERGDIFYIKRLAGTPGDTIQIDEGKLLVNGEAAAGSVAFDRNANKEGLYRGYQYASTVAPAFSGLLHPGERITLPEDSYLALGDNSYNSFDSRGWGYVPEEVIVGRPIMIYYPFTKRFGLAK